MEQPGAVAGGSGNFAFEVSMPEVTEFQFLKLAFVRTENVKLEPNKAN